MFEQLDSIVDRLFPPDNKGGVVFDPSKLPRVAFLATNAAGTKTYSRYAGYSTVALDGSSKAPTRLTDTSVFHMFSATKLVTAVCALQLFEEGKFKMDDLAEKYLPEIASLKVLTDYSEGEPVWAEVANRPTIIDLFRHTSGFTYSTSLEKLEKYCTDRGVAPIWSACKLSSLTEAPYVVQPTSQFLYGTSIDWLGVIVERLSGQTLNEYMTEHVFAPLGMERTSFIQTDAGAEDEVTIMLHSKGADGQHEYAPTTRLTPLDPELHAGGSGLNGTPSDYLKFLRALLPGGVGPQLLRPETAEFLFEPQLEMHQLASATADMATDSDPFCRGERSGHVASGGKLIERSFTCGGSYVSEALPSGRSAGSVTWSGMPNNFWVLDKEKDLAFVIWGGIRPFADELFYDLWMLLEKELYKAWAG